jgi:hypothetical protein
MREKYSLKSCLASLAVIFLSLGFASLLYWNPSLSGKIDIFDNHYFWYPAVFLGSNFLSYCFIVIVAVGFEFALYLIFKSLQVWKIRMFLPSIMILLAASFAAFFLSLNGYWLMNIFYLSGTATVTIRVCVLTIAMTAALLIAKREKK